MTLFLWIPLPNVQDTWGHGRIWIPERIRLMWLTVLNLYKKIEGSVLFEQVCTKFSYYYTINQFGSNANKFPKWGIGKNINSASFKGLGMDIYSLLLVENR